MSFEAALVDEFAALPGIGKKLYPLVAPKGTDAPYVVYGSSAGLPVSTLSGYGACKSIAVDLNVVAASYASMKQYADAVMSLLLGFQGRGIGNSDLLIQQLILEEPDEIYEEETRLYKSVFSFTVYF